MESVWGFTVPSYGQRRWATAFPHFFLGVSLPGDLATTPIAALGKVSVTYDPRFCPRLRRDPRITINGKPRDGSPWVPTRFVPRVESLEDRVVPTLTLGADAYTVLHDHSLIALSNGVF